MAVRWLKISLLKTAGGWIPESRSFVITLSVTSVSKALFDSAFRRSTRRT